ncbi:MAG: exodeoxyribonuclease III [Candidatus Gracilibacteria bacterium]|jgi:exodeoxyribonuclease-3|nr:exodeoxyribonuclease III [Candidatus Gracilibacteria bacterium]
MKIISWNVNGIRAVAKKGLLDFIENEKPDILALQEIKAKEKDIPKNLHDIKGYHLFLNPADRAGYSGVSILTKKKPISVKKGFGIEKFDTEGRLIEADFGDFILLNIYFPNGKLSPLRLNYKIDFYNETINHLESLLKQGKNLIVVGDLNTAHKEIDLARPKENEKVSGFLKIERDLLDKLVEIGMVDAFRHFDKNPQNYTWWSMRSGARTRNVGWRIDYAFVNKKFISKIKSCTHLQEIYGSDHCPVKIEL